jgi:hypothetical protein
LFAIINTNIAHQEQVLISSSVRTTTWPRNFADRAS